MEKVATKRILFIEDFEDDYLLLLRHIKKAGYAVESKRIYERAALEDELKENWDAIICDNKLPGLDAYDALKMVRKVYADLPFIIVSGSLTDKEAVQAMNLGANDYVIKGDYNRFLPALERELREYQIKLEKQEVEGKLIKNEIAFDVITENAQDLLLLADITGKILYISSSVKKLVGYGSGEVLGRNIGEFLPDEDNKRFNTVLSEIKKGANRPYKAVYEVIKSDGSSLFLDNIIKPYMDETGKIGITSTSRDLTETIKFREEISKTQRKFSIADHELQQLIQHANAPIFGLNWSGEINEWNPKLEELTGFSRQEVLQKKLLQTVVPENFHAPLSRIFKHALLDQQATNDEIPLLTKSGEERIILFSSTPRRNYEGDIIGVLCYGQDVTEQNLYRDELEKKVEERTHQLNEALIKEKELAALKTRFISMASHEFKTPLSTISFAAEFIDRYYSKASEDKIRERISKIKEQVSNMVYLLNDVLTIGKSEESKIKIHPKNVNILAFAKKVQEDLENNKKLSHKLLLQLEVSEDASFISDPVLLSNIFVNLIINGMKYSPGKDKVIWKIAREGQEMVFTVQDFGIGIPDEEQEKIFEPFHRCLNTSHIEGTGLGLSIVKRAAETLEGNIRLLNSSKEGTTFEVRLPIK